jgi:hypothetical protein
MICQLEIKCNIEHRLPEGMNSVAARPKHTYASSGNDFAFLLSLFGILLKNLSMAVMMEMFHVEAVLSQTFSLRFSEWRERDRIIMQFY